jgi:hypothetical protein
MTKDKWKSKPCLIVAIIILLCLIGAITAGIMITRNQQRIDDRNILERRRNFNVIFAERNENAPEEMVIIQPGWFIRTHMDYLPPGKVIISQGEWWLERLREDTPFGTILFIYHHWERLETHIYDVLTEERLDTINVLDILALVSDYTEGYNLADILPVVHGNIDGDYYLSWTLRKIPDSLECKTESRQLSYNLQTEEVTFGELLPERFDNERRIERAQRSNIFLNWDADGENRSRFINSNIGVNSREVGEGEHIDFAVMESTVDGLVVITLNSNYLPQESQELYSRFPGLRDYIGEEDLNVSVIISNDITNEEILLMFMEDGRDINFEGAVLRAGWSIDGEEHEIHSFEDFDRLMDFGRWFDR